MALQASSTPLTCAAVDWLFMPLAITAMALFFAAGRGVPSGSCAVPYLPAAFAIAAFACVTIEPVSVELVVRELLVEPLSPAHPPSVPAMRRAARAALTTPTPVRRVLWNMMMRLLCYLMAIGLTGAPVARWILIGAATYMKLWRRSAAQSPASSSRSQS